MSPRVKHLEGFVEDARRPFRAAGSREDRFDAARWGDR
jgi:hypothetical protein